MAATFLNLNLSERRFGQMIIGFFALGFVSLLAAGIGVGWLMVLNQGRTDWVNHTYEVERHVDILTTQIERMESTRRGFLLNRDPAFQAGYQTALGIVPGEMMQLESLTADNPVQQRSLAVLRGQIDQLSKKLAVSMEDAAEGRDEKASRDFESDGSVVLTRQLRSITEGMLAEENRLLGQRAAAQSEYSRYFFAALSVAGVLMVILAGASVLVILRYTRELAASRDSLKDLNENLEQAVDARTVDLQRANDEIQRFAYIVSHDLRSPLVNVLGFTSELDAAGKSMRALIERAEAEAPQILTGDMRQAVLADMPEAIGFIRGSTQKMDRLINAILKLSREGRRTITPELLDMDQLAQGVADSLQHRVDSLGAQIAIDKPLPRLTSDRVAIEQILSNLVENAVKYLQPGRPGRIHVRGRQHLGRAIFEVADNGRGIDPKDHDRVFDLFRRSGVQDQPGEGIGLAHVRALAYRLGGVVSCESALDQGAVFRLSLPLFYSGDRPT